ncbi:FAD-binding protein, partial [Klebsiella aerogenes]|uniref:FAD-binding protein n=1 Tax=Klebsiella aerogenes TaxID=548 RepID=UPI0013D43DC6
FGQGLALAARAGAKLADLEFIQFHPTAFDGPARPMPLVSEAVRGEGAHLIDQTGRRFMADQPGAELSPRDVVARAVWHHLGPGHRVFL